MKKTDFQTAVMTNWNNFGRLPGSPYTSRRTPPENTASLRLQDMTDTRAGIRKSKTARMWLLLILGIHFALLLVMLPDYWADNDLGYHISLARQYAIHGTYFWDSLNWAPTGRPNLQGPLLHFANGMLGRLLGGKGDDYVRAFSVLAVFQWCAVMFTTYFFARRFGGDRAALFACALLSGSAYAAVSFFVGVPSGWIFIFTPWALHFFLERRYAAAALFTSLAMYVHLGGASTAPFAIFLAALLTRAWRGLLLTGGLTAVLTAPYTIHVLRHLEWYTGRRGHVAGSTAWLIYLLAAPGLALLLRTWRKNYFLLIWVLAPLAWFFQDRLRFFLQSTVAASVVAGIFCAWVLQRWPHRRWSAWASAVLLAVATIFPLSVPALPLELLWATGNGVPRELDWNEARTLAGVLDGAALNGRIVNSYYDSLSAAMAVYTDLRQEYGHWGEVRPARNPAAGIPTVQRVYVLPLPPGDPKLGELAAAGLVQIHGGSEWTSIVTLGPPGTPGEIAPLTADILHEEARWLAENARNNRMPPVLDIFSPRAVDELRRQRALQKCHPGRIQLAYLLYAASMDAVDPELARDVRSGARTWGSIANFIGDETAMDYLSDARFALFRANAARFSEAALQLRTQTRPTPELDRISNRLFDDFFEQN